MIQKLISFLQGNDKDEIVLVSTQDGKSFKIKRAFQDKQKDIKKFNKAETFFRHL